MKINNQEFTYELVSIVFNPTRLLRLSKFYNIPFDELIEIY